MYRNYYYYYYVKSKKTNCALGLCQKDANYYYSSYVQRSTLNLISAETGRTKLSIPKDPRGSVLGNSRYHVNPRKLY